MDINELRALQAPLKDRYRAEPQAAVVTLRASGALDSAAVACKVETGRALSVAGLHPATGGSGAELCSGDMLLEALVACAGVTVKAVATSIGVPLRGGGRRSRLSRHARSRARGSCRLHRHSSAVRTGFGRAAGAARNASQADRALLRRAADAAARTADTSHAGPDSLSARNPTSIPMGLDAREGALPPRAPVKFVAGRGLCGRAIQRVR